MPSTYWPDPDKFNSPFAGSIAVNKRDLMWLDRNGLLSQGKAYPAAMMTDQGSEQANQDMFGPLFLGVAAEQLSATQVRDWIEIDREYIGPMSITSGTYYQGDLVAACDNASVNGLLSTKVKLTTSSLDAIGYILVGGTNVTTVTVVLISRVLPKYLQQVQAVNAAGGITMPDATSIALNATTGTKLGTATNQKLGFWNATPVVQPSGASEAAVTLTVGAAVATNASTNTTPYGYSTNTQADAIVTNLNALRVDMLAMNTLVDKLRADLVATGLIKGSA